MANKNMDLPTLGPYRYESNGATYIGNYKNGKRHGNGRQVWKDGSVYQGTWEDDVACGHGRLIHADKLFVEFKITFLRNFFLI